MLVGSILKKFMVSVGKNFVEVHHVKPLSTIGEEIAIDPKNELINVPVIETFPFI